MNSCRCLPVCWPIVAAIVVGLGCTKQQPPRTRDAIFQDRLQVDKLFLTEDGRRVVAPGNPAKAVVVDASAGEIAWLAWQCNNPDCPSRGADGTALVFSRPDPFAYVTPDGAIAIRQPETPADFEKMDDFAEQKCPACLKLRRLDAETPAQREQYRSWCESHVLPATAKRTRQLDEELKRLVDRQQSHKRN